MIKLCRELFGNLEEIKKSISQTANNFGGCFCAYSIIIFTIKKLLSGSGCGSVGRAVASNTRGPWFESSRWQNLLNIC